MLASLIALAPASAFDAVLRRAKAGEPDIVAFVAKARKSADGFLAQTPPSVMDKTECAPSKDRHDYFAPARYYHPDGKGGLVARDGVPNPDLGTEKYDNKAAGRFHNGLKAMTVAYGLTHDAKYAHGVQRWLMAWCVDPATRMNPNMEWFQCIGDRGTPYGIVSGRFLVDAAIAGSSVPLDAAARDKIRGWYAEITKWLTTSKLGVEESRTVNNHATWYAVQLSAYATFAGDEALAKRVIRHTVEKYLGEHFQADGSQPKELARTNSWNYTVYNLDAWAYLDKIGRILGVEVGGAKSANGRTIRAGVDFAATVVDGKQWTYRNIDKVNADRMRNVLRWAAARFPDGPYRDQLAKIKVKTPTPESLGLWPD